MAYIGNNPDSILQGRKALYTITATANQTAFSGLDDNGNTIDLLQAESNHVYLNGSRLVDTADFTLNGDVLTLTSGAASGDIMVITTEQEMGHASSYTKAAADSRYINYDGDIVNGTIQMGGGPGNNITFADNNKIVMGTGNDLEIYHSGTNSYIDDVGEGSLFLRSGTTYIQNAAGTKTSILTNAGAGQTLYHNNTPVFETTSTGVDVTGIAIADEINLDGGGDIHSTNNTGYVGIAGGTNSNVGANALFYGGSHSSLAGVTKFRSGSATNITILSDGKVGIGTSSPSNPISVSGSAFNPSAGGYVSGGIDLQGASDGNGNYTSAISFRMGTRQSSAIVTGIQDTADNDRIGLAFFTNPDGSGASAAEEVVRISSAGNLGIGTTSPTHKLDSSWYNQSRTIFTRCC